MVGDKMAEKNLSHLTDLDGFVSACIFDAESGDALATAGNGPGSFDEMGPLICEVMLAHESVPDYYGADPDRKAEEIIFTLGEQVHMMRPLAGGENCFAHLILERSAGNVGHARMQLKRFDMAQAA